MSVQLLLDNLLTPPVLFFFAGMAATLLRSDLEIPAPLSKLFSLFLLMAIGFKGGVELSKAGVDSATLAVLGAAIGMSLLVPLYVFFVLRGKVGPFNAAAIAATYGSVSAVTFITADAFLKRQEIAFGGHLVAALALMESPAIIVGVMLARRFSPAAATPSLPAGTSAGAPAADGQGNVPSIDWSHLLRDAFLNGSVFLLLASLVIGALTGTRGLTDVKPFFVDLFKGMLCLFLLDMGLVAARRIKDVRAAGPVLLLAAVGVPLLNAALAIGLTVLLKMPQGDALMFTVLCASASYIAVPAAMNIALPEANPSLYVSMALALTFPFNVLVGIPLYMQVIKAVGGV